MSRSRSNKKHIPFHRKHLHVFGALSFIAIFLTVAIGVQSGAINSLFVLSWVFGKGTTGNDVSVQKSANSTNATVTQQPVKDPVPTAITPTNPGTTGGATATPKLTGSPDRSPTPIADGDIFYESPVCPESAHTTTKFHTLWNSDLRCHYDHEHQDNPFTALVASIFPGFNLFELLGRVEIGHTNPSSSMENTHKHGGFKWQVTPVHPQNCDGFEGAVNGVNASVIEYHGFGDYAIELESRTHSSAALLRLCNSANPTDYGYMYTVQLQDYGQRVVPYQGTVFPYPDNPVPAYNSGLGPYLSVDCIGDVAQCRASRELIVSRRLNAATNWTAKPNGIYNTTHPFGSTLFQVFFRARDIYRLIDWNDQVHPFTFIWLCSSDGGRTYDPSGCKYNNSTTQVHEIAGTIPQAWDNMPGFDTDMRVGKVTAQGFTTQFGELNRWCTSPGANCHPLKLVNAPVGKYGSVLYFTPGKGTNLGPFLPERDFYFCNGRICSEGSFGSVPSGWIGQNN